MRTLLSTGLVPLCLLLVSAATAGPPALDGYSSPETLRGRLRSLARSELASYTALARTLGGNDVGLLTVGTGQADSKPAVLVVGGIDPTRPVDSEVVLRLAQRLIEAADADAEVRGLVDRTTFYFIVQAAPDAARAPFEEPLRQQDVNARPIDDDTDGQVDEDGPDDLSGDGMITVMRVEDSGGEYIVHPDDNRVMIEADPEKGEHGRYKLLVEGRDNDGDGQLNEDPPGGVAFDRNFTFDYPYFGRGAGPHQVSEIETRAVADFAFDHPNIVLVWTMSGRDNLLNKWEPDKSDKEEKVKTKLLAADAPYFDKIAAVCKEIYGEGKPPKTSDAKGSFIEWAYFHYGRWSVATRPWWISASKPEDEASEGKEDASDEDAEKDKDDKDERGTEDLRDLAWFDSQGVEGFVDWQPFEHPDLPGKKVEIGGFKPFARGNPPAAMFDDLADTNFKFLLKLGAMLPRVEIADVKVEALGADVWRVTAGVVNQGLLPSAAEMGRLSKEPQRLQVELVLPKGVSLVTGHARRTIDPLAGDGGRAEEKWLVRDATSGKSTLRVKAWSPMAGSAEREVTLADGAE